MGIRTYSWIRYDNPTAELIIGKPNRTVTQNYYYLNAANNSWNKFNTNTTSVVDSNYFTTYNVSAPSGYHAGNNFGFYNSSSTLLNNGTVGESRQICGDNYFFNIHYYANTHTVSYNANGGSGAPGSQTKTYGVAMNVSSTRPTRTGYTFTGWNTASNGTGTTYAAGANYPHDQNGGTVTLYAQWSINSYYFDLNGYLDGSVVGNISGFGTADIYINGTLVANDVTDYYTAWPYGSTYEIKDIKAARGHTYNGVYSGSLSGTIGAGPVGVYLSFSRNTYNITLNPNGGSVYGSSSASTLSPTLVYGTSNWWTVAPATRTGYTFTGYYTAPSGGVKVYGADGKCTNEGTYFSGNTYVNTNNLTVYAQWTANNYTVTYNGNGGTYNGNATWSNTATYDSNYTTEDNFFTRAGHVFVGWNEKADGSGVDWTDWIGKPWKWSYTKDVTLYAQWRNYPPELTVPVMDNPDTNAIAPFISDGKLILQLGDVFTPSKYATAWDEEDGVITENIQITNNVPLVDGKTSATGTFTVVYKITDAGEATSSYTLTVIVNEAPKIIPTDRIFFLNQYGVDEKELLRKVTVTDKEDGDISQKAKVYSIEYADRTENSNFILDTSKVGDITITYIVTDNYKKTSIESCNIKIIANHSLEESQKTPGIRFISNNFLNTLSATSKWLTNLVLNTQLKDSLNKKEGTTYHFSAQDIQNIKQKYGNMNKGTSTNVEFVNEYLNK